MVCRAIHKTFTCSAMTCGTLGQESIKITQFCMQNETNHDYKIKSFVLNRITKWTIFVSVTWSGFEGFGGIPLLKLTLSVPPPPIPGIRIRVSLEKVLNARLVIRQRGDFSVANTLTNKICLSWDRARATLKDNSARVFPLEWKG